MLLTPVNVLNKRATVLWTKVQSQRGPYIYEISDRRVINNKPHVVLKSAPMPYNPMMAMLGGAYAVGPMPEEGGDEI